MVNKFENGDETHKWLRNRKMVAKSEDGEQILSATPPQASPFIGEIGDCSVPGCTDEAACNYSDLATDDDNSCYYCYTDYYYYERRLEILNKKGKLQVNNVK